MTSMTVDELIAQVRSPSLSNTHPLHSRSICQAALSNLCLYLTLYFCPITTPFFQIPNLAALRHPC